MTSDVENNVDVLKIHIFDRERGERRRVKGRNKKTE
jgi:hypothetical protein